MRRRSLFGLFAGAAAAPVVAALPKPVVAAPAALAGESFVDVVGASLNSQSYPWTVSNVDYAAQWRTFGHRMARAMKAGGHSWPAADPDLHEARVRWWAQLSGEVDRRCTSTTSLRLSPSTVSARTARGALPSLANSSRTAASVPISSAPSSAPRSSNLKTMLLSTSATPSSSESSKSMSAPRDEWGSVSVLGNGGNGRIAA